MKKKFLIKLLIVVPLMLIGTYLLYDKIGVGGMYGIVCFGVALNVLYEK